MLLQSILFDASMTVSAALARLARYGIWLNPQQPDAWQWIKEQARMMELPPERVAAMLAEPHHARFGAAIRRQWYQNILWYARPVAAVLETGTACLRDTRLLDAMQLAESDSRPNLEFRANEVYRTDGVVVKDGQPVAVSLVTVAAPDWVSASRHDARPAETRRGFARAVPPAPRPPQPADAPPSRIVSAWPRIESPGYVAALAPFDVTIGFGAQQQRAVGGGQVMLPAKPGVETIDITIDLIANGVDAPDGWSRPLKVPVADPTSASVTFKLVGRVPKGPEPVQLTSIEVRYVAEGTVCGTASTPLVIGPASGVRVDGPGDVGTPWLGQPPTSAAGEFGVDPHAADLTIELAKPDKNPAEGEYVCKLYSRHQLQTPTGPFDVSLGHDAKTFARSVIQGVRQYSNNALVNTFLRSVGALVAEKLPGEVFSAIAEVAALVQPEPPAVLLVSAEPFVPWELALLDTPLDPNRPPFLGAQTVLGRWFRDPKASPAPMGAAKPPRPPVNPPAGIPVQHMAAMAGNYKPASGLKNLPAADAEVDALESGFGAVALLATPQNLLQIIEARLEKGTKTLGPAGAVHFAGHGQYDATEPDSSVLYLTDGTALSSLLFRDAKYGGSNQPIIFFNACMIGVGGEVLGDMGGFPGNCLRGGFGAVLGALWEVDDVVAGAIATEFWNRVMPPGGGPAEPVATVLRDLRANYSAQQPVPTYMAYTYWGHPRLTLKRLP